MESRSSHVCVDQLLQNIGQNLPSSSDSWFMLQVPFLPVSFRSFAVTHCFGALLFGLVERHLSNMDEPSQAEQVV